MDFAYVAEVNGRDWIEYCWRVVRQRYHRLASFSFMMVRTRCRAARSSFFMKTIAGAIGHLIQQNVW